MISLTNREEIEPIVASYNAKRDPRLNTIAISCWHLSEDESAAMWQRYAPKGLGIAIQTTVNRLQGALFYPLGIAEFPGRAVHYSPVHYVDYATQILNEDSAVFPAFFKRREFAYEREYRALVELTQQEQGGVIAYMAFRQGGRHIFRGESGWEIGDSRAAIMRTVVGPGILVDVHVPHLIERLVLAPGTPLSYVDLIKNLGSKYGLDAPVEPTSIDASPYDHLEF